MSNCTSIPVTPASDPVTEPNFAFAFLLVSISGLSTTLGAAAAFCINRSVLHFLPISLSLSAGVMIYVSLVEIFAVKAVEALRVDYPRHGYSFATGLFFGGILLTGLFDQAGHALTHLIEARKMKNQNQHNKHKHKHKHKHMDTHNHNHRHSELCEVEMQKSDPLMAPEDETAAAVGLKSDQTDQSQSKHEHKVDNDRSCDISSNSLNRVRIHADDDDQVDSFVALPRFRASRSSRVESSSSGGESEMDDQQTPNDGDFRVLSRSSRDHSHRRHNHTDHSGADNRSGGGCACMDNLDDILAEMERRENQDHMKSGHLKVDENELNCSIHHQTTVLQTGKSEVKTQAGDDGAISIALGLESVQDGTGDAASPSAPSIGDDRLISTGVLTGLALAIHNAPEGLITFIGALSDPSVGIALCVAISLHNIPEGICVAMPIFYATNNRWKAFFWAFMSGLTEPISAMIGYYLLKDSLNDTVYGILFSLVSGMMIYISFKELLPTAHRYDPQDRFCSVSLITGMAAMALSLALFQSV